MHNDMLPNTAFAWNDRRHHPPEGNLHSRQGSEPVLARQRGQRCGRKACIVILPLISSSRAVAVRRRASPQAAAAIERQIVEPARHLKADRLRSAPECTISHKRSSLAAARPWHRTVLHRADQHADCAFADWPQGLDGLDCTFVQLAGLASSTCPVAATRHVILSQVLIFVEFISCERVAAHPVTHYTTIISLLYQNRR
jgi:hypothetical protein